MNKNPLAFFKEKRNIAACRSKRMVAFLQALKETFADPGEILKLQWTDISDNALNIRPVKGHKPRQLNISSKLVAMLNNLPRTSERIFPTTYDSMYPIFSRLRKRVAATLQNPRIKAISFNTFRHWGGTMPYHQTRDILLVQKILGHKRIENTMKYTQLVCFHDNDYDVATVTTLEEDQQLLKVGFEYVTDRNGIKLYRKPKTFAKLQN